MNAATATLELPAVDKRAERERHIDVLTKLHNHYRLAEWQSEQAVSENERLGAGSVVLSVLRAIAANDALLSRQYRLELELAKSRNH